MRGLKLDLFGWVIVIAFLVTIFYLYNEFDTNHYEAKTSSLQTDASRLTELHPTVSSKSDELVLRAKEQNIRVVITDGLRTFSEQDQLYNQGRTQKGQVVTQARAGQSYHNFGLAIDFAIQDHTGAIIWDMDYDGNENGVADWLEVVEIAKDLGFSWGGDWIQFKDYPHLEMNFDLTLEQLRNGLQPNER